MTLIRRKGRSAAQVQTAIDAAITSAGGQSAAQVSTAIAAALASGDYQNAAESDTRIAAALAAGDYQTAAESDTRIAAALASGDYQTAAESDARIAAAITAALATAIGRPSSVMTHPADTNGMITGALTANSCYFEEISHPLPALLSKIAYFCQAASGNVCAGVLTSADGVTFNRVATSGSVAAAGTAAVQELTMLTPITPDVTKRYFLAFAPDNAVITVLRTSGANQPASAYRGKIGVSGSAFPIPTSFSPPATTGAMPWLEAS